MSAIDHGNPHILGNFAAAALKSNYFISIMKITIFKPVRDDLRAQRRQSTFQSYTSIKPENISPQVMPGDYPNDPHLSWTGDLILDAVRSTDSLAVNGLSNR